MYHPDGTSLGAEMPSPILRQLEQAAQRHESPCGDGAMVWHSWGDGPALVLLHGGAGSWRHWVRNIAVLAKTRRVLVADIPGLGESAMPPEPCTMDSLAGIIGEGIDQILGAEASYDIAGFSFGGVVSGSVALLHGTRVRSLTVIGSGGLGLPRNVTELVKVRHLTGRERLEAHAYNLSKLMIADPANIDDLAVEIQDWNTRHSRLKTPVLSRGTSLREALAKFGGKLNGIYGERDAASWPSIVDREILFRRLHADVTFRIIPGAGHWVPYEAADEFNGTLLDMLQRS
jgi:pimeloyl-ACP methyl ester carboxylesterase